MTSPSCPVLDGFHRRTQFVQRVSRDIEWVVVGRGTAAGHHLDLASAAVLPRVAAGVQALHRAARVAHSGAAAPKHLLGGPGRCRFGRFEREIGCQQTHQRQR